MSENKGQLLKSDEVAGMLRVHPKTIIRWANAGRLPSIKTPGGHMRFWESDVHALFVDEVVIQ